jgi:hypothetical protein
VLTNHLADGAVAAAKLAAGAVAGGTGGVIADNSITAADLASGSVQADEIDTGAVGSDEIGAGAVGASEVQNGSLAQADVGKLSGTVSIDPPNIAGGDCATVTATVTGVSVGDVAIVNAETGLDGSLSVSTLAPSANTLNVRLCNIDAVVAVNDTSRSFSYVILGA